MARTWRTQDGRELLPSEMSLSHLTNAVRMLQRNVERYRSRMLMRLWRYAENAPDGAAAAAELEAEMLEDASATRVLTYCFPVYKDLLQELSDRRAKPNAASQS